MQTSMRKAKMNKKSLVAAVIGLSIALAVFFTGLVLLSTRSELSNRSVLSVLVKPDYELIRAPNFDRRYGALIEAGGCFSEMAGVPDVSSGRSDFERYGHCLKWRRIDCQIGSSPQVCRWSGDLYEVIGWDLGESNGHARSEATALLGESLESLLRKLPVPLGLCLSIYFGWLVAMRYLKRSS